MKCINCDKLLPDGAKFCPECGSPVNETFTEKKNIKEKPSYIQYSNNNTVATTLTFGTLALCISFFLGGYIGLTGILFGIFAIINGIKFIKTPYLKKAMLGMTFGLLGICLGLISLIQMGIANNKLNSVNEKYELVFRHLSPNKEPESYLFYFQRFDETPFWSNEYHYNLESQEVEALYNRLDWTQYRENTDFSYIAHEIGIDLSEGSFCIHNMDGLLDLENRFDYYIIYVDPENNEMIIVEVWK